MGFLPCWSCGSTGRCYSNCECAKCLDPEDYADWKRENPEQYKEWLETQRYQLVTVDMELKTHRHNFLRLRYAQEAAGKEEKPEEPKIRTEYSAGGLLRSIDGMVLIEEIEVDGAAVYVEAWKNKEGLVEWRLQPDVPITSEVRVEPLPIPQDPFALRAMSDKPQPVAVWSLAGEPLEYGSDHDLWLEIRQFIHEHVQLDSEEAYDVAVADTLASALPELWDTYPYLSIQAPKRTGKSQFLLTIAMLSYRGLFTPPISVPTIVYYLHHFHVYTCFDEVEDWGDEAKEVIGILNHGYKRGGTYPVMRQTEGGGWAPIPMDVFGFKGFSGINPVKYTLEDRCVKFHMLRKTRDVRYPIDWKKAKLLRSKILLWRMRKLLLGELKKPDSYRDEDLAKLGIQLPDGFKRVVDRQRELYMPFVLVAPDLAIRENIVNFALRELVGSEEAERMGEDAKFVEAFYNTAELRDNVYESPLRALTEHWGLQIDQLNPQTFEGWRRSLETTAGIVAKRLGFVSRSEKVKGERKKHTVVVAEKARVETLVDQYGIDRGVSGRADLTNPPGGSPPRSTSEASKQDWIKRQMNKEEDK
jgi:hypothetical protein